MKVYLIRHAQAQHNVSGNTGHFDPEITELGRQQCAENKHRYRDVNMILTSTATRTLQTTSQLFTNISVHATDLLLEYNTGASCNQRHDLTYQALKFPTVDFDTYLVPKLDKEVTWQDGEARAKKVIELLDKIKNNNIVLAIVSHANFIRNIITLLQGYQKEELENCQAYIVTIR